MSNEFYQFEKRDDEGVTGAASLAAEFVAAVNEGKHAGRSLNAAVGTVAKESRIGKAFIFRLIQPSRRPKSIGWGTRSRLFEAYLRYLRRQHREIELKIIRLEALARNDPGAVRDLLGEAQALQNRIKALL